MDWIPDFAGFTTQNWLAFWSVVVASAAVVANIGIAMWNGRRTSRKLSKLESSMTRGLSTLDDKINAVDWNYAYVVGTLKGAGLTRNGSKTVSKYTPGEQAAAFADTVRPSLAVEAAFEQGFYEGDYAVVSNPQTPLRPELEAILHAAATKWPRELVAFNRIVDWAGEGALDPLTGSRTMADSPLNPQRRALLLIHNGLFERHS